MFFKKAKSEPDWNHKINLTRYSQRRSMFEIAKLCNVDANDYVRWETGMEMPNDIQKAKIAKALGVRIEEIFGEAKREPTPNLDE